jgi:hypothetical protein
MRTPQSLSEILRGHVELELESIDRMYLNAYVPGLQWDRGVVSFFRYHRGDRVVSGALMAPISRAFVAAIERFARREGVDLVRLRKGERKDEVARRYLARFRGEEGVLFIGVAQEKAGVFRTERRRDEKGESYPGSSAPRRW